MANAGTSAHVQLFLYERLHYSKLVKEHMHWQKRSALGSCQAVPPRELRQTLERSRRSEEQGPDADCGPAVSPLTSATCPTPSSLELMAMDQATGGVCGANSSAELHNTDRWAPASSRSKELGSEHGNTEGTRPDSSVRGASPAFIWPGARSCS